MLFRSLRGVVDARGGTVALEVVDVLERPDLAERDAVVATPTLLRLAPEPVLRVIGDLEGDDELLAHLLDGEAQLR